jgi:hypothetical protein
MGRELRAGVVGGGIVLGHEDKRGIQEASISIAQEDTPCDSTPNSCFVADFRQDVKLSFHRGPRLASPRPAGKLPGVWTAVGRG